MLKENLKEDLKLKFQAATHTLYELGLRKQAIEAAVEPVILKALNKELDDKLREELQLLYNDDDLYLYIMADSFLIRKFLPFPDNDDIWEYEYQFLPGTKEEKEEMIAEGWQVITLTKEEKYILNIIADHKRKILQYQTQQTLIPGFKEYAFLAELFNTFIGFDNAIEIINQHKKGVPNMEEVEKELQAKPELKQLLEATLEAQKRGVAIKDIIALVENYTNNK